MLSKAHDTHLSQHSALPQHDIRWWNQENTTHTHTTVHPAMKDLWIPDADGVRPFRQLQTAVCKVQFFICISTKEIPAEMTIRKLTENIRQSAQIGSHKNMVFPVGTNLLVTLQQVCRAWGTTDTWILTQKWAAWGTYRTDSSWLLHSSQQKVSQLSWSLHTSWDLSSVVSKLSRLVTVGFSAAASFDSLGSFILSVQSAPMFSTSPLTFSVSTLAITYLLFLAERFLSESKSLFHSILERNPRRCLKGMSWNYM